MECGVCGILLDEDLMIPGKYGFGVCIDCAKEVIAKIVEVLEKHEWSIAAELIALELAKAKLLPTEVLAR